jgi:hypothetical protein
MLSIRFVTASGAWLERSGSYLIREDGRVERLCEHGIGHCVGHLRRWEKWMGVHGCDGCCREYEEYTAVSSNRQDA